MASESRNVGETELAAVDMDPPEFGTAVKLGKDLAGVQQPAGVESAFQALLLVQVGLGELLGHQVALLDADAVLSGQHAADLDAKLQDIGAELLRPLQLARNVGIVEDQRVQVAVAGME